MRHFVKRAVLYVVLLMLVLLGIECLLLFVSNEYTFKRDYMNDNADKIKVLFLGHSWFQVGVNPVFVSDSAFNAATSGRAPWYDAQLLERYASKMHHLEYVIMPLHLGHVYNGEKANEQTKKTKTYICMQVKYLHLESKYNPSLLFWSEFINSDYDFIKRFWTRDAAMRNNCDSVGYSKQLLSKRSADWYSKKCPKKGAFDDRQLSEEFIEDYLRIASECNKLDVKLIVVVPPVYKTYQDAITEKWGRDIVLFMDRIRARYPGVQFYNLAFDERFEADDFFDACHLNDQGATKFSKIIKTEILHFE